MDSTPNRNSTSRRSTRSTRSNTSPTRNNASPNRNSTSRRSTRSNVSPTRGNVSPNRNSTSRKSTRSNASPTRNNASPKRNSTSRKSTRSNASVDSVKSAFSPNIKASVNSVKDTLSPKIKAALNGIKAYLSPSNIVNSFRQGRRRRAARVQTPQDEKELLNQSPTKLGPEEVKNQLGTCGTDHILQSQPNNINNCSNKVNEFMNDMEDLDNAHQEEDKYEIPKSEISEEKEVKDLAQEDYMHLAAKPEESLVLPAKHKVLYDYFRATESVVSLLHNRQEVITFSKLQTAVQGIMKKNFSQDILSKIITVFPDAYALSQDKTKTLHGSFEYNLVVSPCFEHNVSSFTYVKMTPAILTARKNIFQNNLIQMVKMHHDKFLIEFYQCKPLVPEDTPKRWHQEFDLDEVPDVAISQLPQPPEAEKYDNAVDVLSKAMDMIHLESGATNVASAEPEQEVVIMPSTKVNSSLKGVPSSLLQKVRAREAASASQSALTKSKAQNKQLELLSGLPEFVRIIRNTFITERKSALPWEVLVNKVSATHSSSIEKCDVDNHLHSLVKEAPEWLTVCNVSKGTYLKINKDIDVNDVIKELQNLLKLKK